MMKRHPSGQLDHGIHEDCKVKELILRLFMLLFFGGSAIHASNNGDTIAAAIYVGLAMFQQEKMGFPR